MTRRFVHALPAALAAALLLLALPAAAQPAPALTYVYAVKYVCGYNPTNVGLSHSGNKEGEPTVKFGNYATDINILNPTQFQANVRKQVIHLVKEFVPVGREPAFSGPSAFDAIALPPFTATMDDCNRIAELIYGVGLVPTPLPLFVGFLVLESQVELDVTAVYTAEACSNWVNQPFRLECLNTADHHGVSVAINVEQITPRIR